MSSTSKKVKLKNKQQGYFLGIDGGGSNCKAVIANQQGEIIGSGISGPASTYYGVENCIGSIIDATEKAIASIQIADLLLSDLQAGLGLAGVNLPSLHDKISQWSHPFALMVLTTDMDIANIGAHDGQDGAVIIVGTGSSAFINTNNRQSTMGGFGFPLGDQASGGWLGLKAIEHTLLVLDGVANKSLLAKNVCDFYSISNGVELSEALAGKASNEYAKIASIVFSCADQNDPEASDLINQGINYISQLAKKIFDEKPMRLSMIGGLSQFYLPRLSAEVANLFSDAINPPEIGAIQLVMRAT